MTDIRCPICDTLNPPDAEVCSNCGTRLTYLEGDSDFIDPAEAPELPDWLKSYREGDEPEPEEPSESDDWLESLRGAVPSEGMEPEEEEPAGFEPVKPVDWMARLANEPLAARSFTPGEPSGKAPSTPEEPEASQPEAGEGKEQPGEAGFARAFPEPEGLAEQSSAEETEEDSTWLDALRGGPSDEEASPAEEKAPEPEEREGSEEADFAGARVFQMEPDPDSAWSASAGESPEEEAQKNGADIPDWPVEESGEPLPESQPEYEEQPEEPDLAGELEAALPPAVEEEPPALEDTGPLAGIAGVIPGSSAATRFTPPPAYSSRVVVNDKQRLHAALLESLVHEKVAPAPAARERRRSRPAGLGRLIVGLILIAAVLLPRLVGPFASQLALFPPETIHMREAIAGLSGSIPPRVLVVIDYQPAYAPELETAAQGPLLDLLRMNARIAILSTHPAGPVLADRLLDAVENGADAFQPEEELVNLGYLPGGASGLQAFALAPQRVIQSTFDTHRFPWQLPAVSGIETIADFNAVLVLTDSLEGGQAWIEQAGPLLDGTPLLMVASAQAGPLLLPYQQSGQIDGLVSGLVGGGYYSTIQANPDGPALQRLSSYQAGLIVILGITLLGSLAQLAGSRSKSTRSTGV